MTLGLDAVIVVLDGVRAGFGREPLPLLDVLDRSGELTDGDPLGRIDVEDVEQQVNSLLGHGQRRPEVLVRSS